MLELWTWFSDSILANAEFVNFILICSVISFLAAMFLMPLVASKIPADYFSDEHKKPFAPQNVILYLLYKILKNLFGVFMALLGVILLFTPGQGLLCILIASILLDYPGKFRFQRFLISKKPVWKGLNWLRKISGVGPLEF